MKIIFVTATLTSGGSERVMSLLANELSQKGYDISIICLTEAIVFYPLHNNVKVIFAKDFSENLLSRIFWLRRFIQEKQPDVVIPFMVAVYCMTIFSLLGTNIPIISSERIDPRHTNKIKNILRKILLRYTTHLVVQTPQIEEFYSEAIQAKTTIIPNPVSDVFFTSTFNEYPKIKQIINVARLYPQKNQKMLIKAFSMISNRFPQYKLVIYGEGPLRTELEQLVKEESLTEKVFLPGKTNDIISELCRSDIFCLTSNYEGMSNAMLEAICIGLPIITTNVSGIEDLVTDGENGFVVETGDTEAFARKLSLLLDSPLLRKNFYQNNIMKSNRFKLSEITLRWEVLIKQIIEKKENKKI
jgi:glycosyltransferase involved in cell wall biosynthesis